MHTDNQAITIQQNKKDSNETFAHFTYLDLSHNHS